MNVWATIAFVSALCLGLRSALPVLMRGRQFPVNLERRLEAVSIPIIAGLVAQDLFTRSHSITVDARSLGVLAGCAVFVTRRSLIAAFLVAALVTALWRAAFG